MTIAQWLKKMTKMLEDASVATARLDAEVLLSDVLQQKDRAWLLAHQDHALQGATLQKVDGWVERRAMHEPIAYIRGKQEFYGREFIVSPATLTPRPETETLVELALDIIKQENITSVADIGTGSGCIIITLEQESRQPLSFIGYDISGEALEIAQKNAEKFTSKANFLQDDITKDCEHHWRDTELIVANLPYVPNSFSINLAATHEPNFAIYGGIDGLEYYRHLFRNVGSARYIVTESLPPQHEELAQLAYLHDFKQIKKQDLIQVFQAD